MSHAERCEELTMVAFIFFVADQEESQWCAKKKVSGANSELVVFSGNLKSSKDILKRVPTDVELQNITSCLAGINHWSVTAYNSRRTTSFMGGLFSMSLNKRTK